MLCRQCPGLATPFPQHRAHLGPHFASAPCHPPQSALTCTVLQVAEVADLTDAMHPHLHLLLRLGHKIECARRGLDNEHEVVLEFLANKAWARMLPDGALAEVDGADGLAGTLAAVVLQHVTVATQSAPPQHEPAPAPGLWERQADIGLRDRKPQNPLGLFHFSRRPSQWGVARESHPQVEEKYALITKAWNTNLQARVLKKNLGTSLVVQLIRFRVPNVGDPSSIPTPGTRSHKPQLTVLTPQLSVLTPQLRPSTAK